jgi:radical SAM protein
MNLEDRARSFQGLDFAQTPFTVIWEVTRACDLRCIHCRADAQAWRHPLELTTAEGYRLLEQVRDLGSPVFVITGGDPLKRDDLYDLVAYGVRLGLSVAVTPSATPLLTGDAIRRLQDLGVRRLALSLDGPGADTHDAFRRQPGSYDTTLAGIRHAVACGLPVQVNTTVTRRNRASLPALAALVGDLGAVMWSVFFLVAVGRAQDADQLTAAEYEEVFDFLYRTSQHGRFAVRTAAAPHYRRFVLQQQVAARRAGHATPAHWVAGMVGDMPRARRGVTDGSGLVFISHTGDVCPSGFLPLTAGNVRETPLGEIYRTAPLFRRLRDDAQLLGKCGVCEFRKVCTGSRARAYAATGDPMASEPLCAYDPPRAARAQFATATTGAAALTG